MKFELKPGWTAEIEYTVEDAGVHDTGYSPRFFPDLARVRFEGGVYSEVAIFGFRELAGGAPSKSTREFTYWTDNLADAPDWVRDEIVAEAEQTLRSVR